MAYYYAARRRNDRKPKELLYQPQLDRAEIYVGRFSVEYVTDLDGQCWLYLFDLGVVFGILPDEKLWPRLPEGSVRQVTLPVSIKAGIWRRELVVNEAGLRFMAVDSVSNRGKACLKGLLHYIAPEKRPYAAKSVKVHKGKLGIIHAASHN